MTQDEKEQLIQIINSELIKLTQKADELKEFTEPISPNDAIGRISRMDAINNKTVFDASLRNTQARLSQLSQALHDVTNSDYGICMKCKQSIPFERLKIRPEVKLCANCFIR